MSERARFLYAHTIALSLRVGDVPLLIHHVTYGIPDHFTLHHSSISHRASSRPFTPPVLRTLSDTLILRIQSTSIPFASLPPQGDKDIISVTSRNLEAVSANQTTPNQHRMAAGRMPHAAIPSTYLTNSTSTLPMGCRSFQITQ